MAVNAAAAAASDPPPAAFVYSGPGAGTRSVLSTLQSLREVLLPSVKVGQSCLPMCNLAAVARAALAIMQWGGVRTRSRTACFELHPGPLPPQVDTLETAQLLAGGWQPGCLLLVMPGGAYLPYCKHLKGKGNQLIRGGGR